MVVPRLFLGKYSGTVGIKTSLPGFDVNDTADDFNMDRRSFNSQWGDIIAKIALVGRSAAPSGGTNIMHGLGYVPYFDARPCEGNVFFDDMYAGFAGVSINDLAFRATAIDSSKLKLAGRSTSQAVYIIWKTPLVSP